MIDILCSAANQIKEKTGSDAVIVLAYKSDELAMGVTKMPYNFIRHCLSLAIHISFNMQADHERQDKAQKRAKQTGGKVH